jgi:hypothetical protein
MHLQSIKISPDVDEINDNIEVINKSKSQMLYKRISKAFTQQQQQAEIFKEHESHASIPLLFGDMNNSAYSYFTEI